MIEAVTSENLEEVLPLIRHYQSFYQVSDICDEKNRQFFSQFGPDSSQGCQFILRENGKVTSFASIYFSFSSTMVAKVAVLNDLFTLPEYRGQGVARRLVEFCRQFAAEKGAARLQWVTTQDNEQAQYLYDSLDAKKSDWCFYAYPV